jgi:heterodisulfide reductase subunit C
MIPTFERGWSDFVQGESRQNLGRCFACAKCTAGCPLAPDMEYGPHRILQMVRFGMKQDVLASRDIWLCAGCETCGTRCPNDVDIAQMMDVLRQLSIAGGVRNPASDVADFHRIFLGLVRTFGRMHEVSLLALFKMRSRDLLGDLGAGAQLFIKGKIPILPEHIKNSSRLRSVLEYPKPPRGKM